MKFIKGNLNGFDKLKKNPPWNDKAKIVQSQMAEVFGAKNLSFLLGSGCSSLCENRKEFGIPTMAPLATEFQSLLNARKRKELSFVTSTQKADLKSKIGIDLSANDVKANLEKMMEVLMNAYQFCRASRKSELKSAAGLVEEIIDGLQRYVLHKCTNGSFSNGDEQVVELYQRFYQSLATRSRGLAPPWVFTTNYDLFNERAMDRSGIPYSNGFSGTVERRFNPATYRLALAEQLDITSRRWAAVDGFVHFCKLHGSINWIGNHEGLYSIREAYTPLNQSTERVMIYPTPAKQTASFGSPYSDMFREFQGQIAQNQSVLVVAGFSFGDEHINNIIFQGLTLPSFRLVAFMDPNTNETTRKLRELRDPRIWFIWGSGSKSKKKAHYFDDIVNHLLPIRSDQKIDQAIGRALRKLVSKQQGH